MLVDSNTLLRTLQPANPQYRTATEAIRTLAHQGEELCIVPQNLVEVWAVDTRPVSNNGLGMSIETAAKALTRLKSLFIIRAETEAIYDVWESLVVQQRVSGKAAHDARLVAAMRVHGLKSILTFNTSDFHRYRGITAINPADVVSEQIRS